MYFIDFHQVGFLSDTYLRAVGHDCPIHAHISYASSQMLMMMIMVMVMLLLIMVIIISTMIAPFMPLLSSASSSSVVARPETFQVVYFIVGAHK